MAAAGCRPLLPPPSAAPGGHGTTIAGRALVTATLLPPTLMAVLLLLLALLALCCCCSLLCALAWLPVMRLTIQLGLAMSFKALTRLSTSAQPASLGRGMGSGHGGSWQ